MLTYETIRYPNPHIFHRLGPHPKGGLTLVSTREFHRKHPQEHHKKTRGIACYDNGKLVGLHLYDTYRSHYTSHLTWVHHKYRRQRVAEEMWSVSLIDENPKVRHIHIEAASRAGSNLINTLQASFDFSCHTGVRSVPLDWDVDDDYPFFDALEREDSQKGKAA